MLAYLSKTLTNLTRAGESASKMALFLGCWQEASVPHHVDLSIGLPECSQVMVAIWLPSVQVIQKSKAECLL